MKRFAMTISLAACLVFLCGTFAMAANQVVAESKSVLPSATGVQCGVFIDNDVDITGLVLPLEIRTLSGGAYMVAGGFSRDHSATGRLANSPLGNADGGGAWPAANITRRTFAVLDAAVANCTDNSGAGGWNTAAALPDFVSPDAVFHATVSTGDPNIGELIVMPAGADAPGNPSYRLIFNVGAAQGQFVVDTTCVRPANHLAFTDINTQPIAPAFTAGIITVEIPPNQCPGSLTAVPNPAAASVGSSVQVQLGATDPEGDPLAYFPSRGSVNASGLWTDIPTCADVPSYVVTVEISDNQHPSQGACQ